MVKFTGNLLKAKDVLEQRFEVKYKLGSGGFGQVFKGQDTQNHLNVAIKVEPRTNRQLMTLEYEVLRKYKSQHAPKVFAVGSTTELNYMVMELLSKNLTTIRQESPLLKFSSKTTFSLAIECLEAITDLHKCGFLHRDVKPSNFVMGLSRTSAKTVYMIDFGLVRQLYHPNGRVKEARNNVGFRGTVRYASVSAHDGKDLGRVDDLWSLLYSIVEMGRGKLPWRRMKNRLMVGRYKKEISVETLTKHLSPQLASFAYYLESLDFYSEPNYGKIVQWFRIAQAQAHSSKKQRHTTPSGDLGIVGSQNQTESSPIRRKSLESAIAAANAPGPSGISHQLHHSQQQWSAKTQPMTSASNDPTKKPIASTPQLHPTIPSAKASSVAAKDKEIQWKTDSTQPQEEENNQHQISKDNFKIYKTGIINNDDWDWEETPMWSSVTQEYLFATATTTGCGSKKKMQPLPFPSSRHNDQHDQPPTKIHADGHPVDNTQVFINVTPPHSPITDRLPVRTEGTFIVYDSNDSNDDSLDTSRSQRSSALVSSPIPGGSPTGSHSTLLIGAHSTADNQRCHSLPQINMTAFEDVDGQCHYHQQRPVPIISTTTTTAPNTGRGLDTKAEASITSSPSLVDVTQQQRQQTTAPKVTSSNCGGGTSRRLLFGAVGRANNTADFAVDHPPTTTTKRIHSNHI